MPAKLTYTVGEALDLNGMVVTASYSDSKTTEVKGYSISGYDGSKAGKQTVTVTYMGYTATFEVQVNEKSVPQDKKYKIISGDGNVYTGSNTIEFIVDGEFANFTDVRVAGKILARDTDYTVREGSTIITLLPAWLNSRADGNYPIEILFKDGLGSGTVRIAIDKASSGDTGADTGKTSDTAVSTGDHQNVALWLVLSILSLISLAGIVVILCRRARTNSK